MHIINRRQHTISTCNARVFAWKSVHDGPKKLFWLLKKLLQNCILVFKTIFKCHSYRQALAQHIFCHPPRRQLKTVARDTTMDKVMFISGKMGKTEIFNQQKISSNCYLPLSFVRRNNDYGEGNNTEESTFLHYTVTLKSNVYLT